ncbi:HNH endonuclease [Lysobacter sp. D1-1-M9]|uniref:HNH endonuclease n=1 Tax=Novilysobacter longmucuonensis TaxID=3098603 RepID=UPI002FC8BAE5
MSARIGQIIEVVEEVRSNCRGASPSVPITQIRINAVRSVAARRSITTNSVADKFIRQLSPDVLSTTQFDSLLQGWLVAGSTELRDIALKHAIDSRDRQLIASAFHIASPQDTLLSEEFGLDAADATFQEGREKLKIHLAKERNRHLISLAKELWRRNGELKCSICSFSFSSAYGEAGDGYIEAHHTTPVSELAENTIVRPTDLAPVCSNCHGIIHRHRPWLTIEQMQAIVARHARAGA